MQWGAEILQIICPWVLLLLISVFLLKNCPVVEWFMQFQQCHPVVQRLVLSPPQDKESQVYVMYGWHSESASMSVICPRASGEEGWLI